MEELLNKLSKYLEKKNKVYITKIADDLQLQEHEVYGLVTLLK